MASSSSSTTKKLLLVSSDHETFEVEEATALQSQTIKNIIEDGCDDGKVPLQNVRSRILAKVIEYCKEHSKEKDLDDVEHEQKKEEFDEKYADGMKDDQELLFDVMEAANYLEIKGLIDLVCKKVAEMMKGKTVEAIHKEFHVRKDFTPEEEKKNRKKNAWAYE